MDKNYSFQRVYQALNISATIKSQPEDFIVEENMDIGFSGDGEHCWLYVKKRECNTDWVAQQLAKYCKVKKLAVSYAGLKDRHAVTSQWFSVQLPGKPTPDWATFESFFSANASAVKSNETIQVVKNFRHNRKLQRGALKSNNFKMTLRELSDSSEDAFKSLAKRCAEIAEKGVPNYFGPQRFGRAYNNLEQAEKLFLKPHHKIAKHKRSLYLSAARSWMFNVILSERIKQNIWDIRLPGDVFMLDGKSACFVDDVNAKIDQNEIDQRLVRNKVHPTVILWGEGDAMTTSQAGELESKIINQFPIYRDGLIAARLQSKRRSCRVVPANLECSQREDNFIISFTLPPGSYATMVLAEIFSELQEPR